MDEAKLYEGLLAGVEPPLFVRARYALDQPQIDHISGATRRALDNCPALDRIEPGQSVAIGVGSREIYGMADMVRQLVDAVKRRGGMPFIVPAMGSHGGATAQGQRAVLAHYGVTQAAVGAPIHSSMDTVAIGQTDKGFAVHIDRLAHGADHIAVLGRIKPHTDFRGPAESGLMKMLAIGLGKQQGASICHKLGFPRMGDSVWAFGRTVLRNAKVLMGLAVVENGRHRPALIEAVPAEAFETREPELLNYAKSLMPKVPFDPIDVLVVHEAGKEISGAGMDPNVTGRSGTLGEFWPHAEKICVLDLTDKSDGNASGVGNADAITRRLYDKIDRVPMYVNAITCRDTIGPKLPAVMPTGLLALKFCLYTCIRRDALVKPRVVYIKNTADLSTMYLSQALADQARDVPGLTALTQPQALCFHDFE